MADRPKLSQVRSPRPSLRAIRTQANTEPIVQEGDKNFFQTYAPPIIRGAAGFAPGGLIGSIAGGGSEILAEGIEGRPIDWREVGLQTGIGAIPFHGAATLGKAALKGAGLAGGNILASQQLHQGLHVPTPEEAKQIAINSALGGVGGAGAHYLGSKFGGGKEPIVKLKETSPIIETKGAPVDLEVKPVEPIIVPEAKQKTKKSAGTNPKGKYAKENATHVVIPDVIEEPVIKTEEPKVLAQSVAPPVNLPTPQAPAIALHKPGGWTSFVDTIKAAKPRDYINLAKATSAAGDFSFPLRQGLTLGTRKAWWDAWKPMVKAIKTANYEQSMREIAEHPRYQQAIDGGLHLKGPLGDGEEQFGSRIATHIPIIGEAVSMSERAYDTFAKKLRLGTFNEIMNAAEKSGEPVNPEQIAQYINTMTGRGSMGLTIGSHSDSAERAATFLNNVLFSPRFIASRVQLLNPYTYYKLDPFTRKQAARDLLPVMGAVSSALFLANANGAKVDTDFSSSNFLKAKVGNSQVDILGGFGPYLRLAAQAGSSKIKGTKGPDLWQFAKGKLSPTVSGVIQSVQGKDFFGKDTTIPKTVARTFVPLFLQDMKDVIADESTGAPAKVGLGAGAFTGASISTRGDNTKRSSSSRMFRPTRTARPSRPSR